MDYLDESGPSMLGPQLLRLLNSIVEGSTTLLESKGHVFPAHLSSTLLVLDEFGASGKTFFAKRLGVSHQLTTHRIEKLKKLRLVREKRDPNDGRRILISLTAKGQKSVDSLNELTKHLNSAYFELFDEIGVDLFEAVVRARKFLEQRPLNERIDAHQEKASRKR